MVVPVVVLAADVELAGPLLFIFRASSSGLEAGAVLTLLPGPGSRFMTGMAELEVASRGAARRLLRVVVVVELVEEAGWVEVAAGGETDFSGSGAKRGQQKGQSEELPCSSSLNQTSGNQNTFAES